MRKIMTMIVVGVLCSSVAILSGCNTVKGIGKDVSKGGQELEKAAS